MSDPLRFAFDGDEYVLASAHRRERLEPEFEPLSTWEGRRLLAGLLDGSGPRTMLRERLGDHLSTSGWSDHGSFRRRVEALLAEGLPGMVLLRRLRPVVATVMSDVPAEELADSTSAEDLSEQGWVEVVVVGEDDEPCANLEYEIELSDGRLRRGRTNEHGILRYEGIPEGTCKVQLTSLDAAVWDLE